MNAEAKDEIQDEARELLLKCGRMMTPGVVETLENIVAEDGWRWSESAGWSLYDNEAEDELREIKVLYFSQLIAA
jgi:hypothetical protein